MLKLKECSSFTHAKSDKRVNQDSILTPTRCDDGFLLQWLMVLVLIKALI